MNRSSSKRVARKKVIPLHCQKNKASLSQILTTASYKRRIKELQKNNKVLAVGLQGARLEVANSNKLLQQCSNQDAKILLAKTKLKDMVGCIQTLVFGLDEVIRCLDLKHIGLFNRSLDKIRMKIRHPDLDTIEESSSLIEDSNINVSVSGRNSLGPIISEQRLATERTPVTDLDTVVEDQGTAGIPYNSIPRALPPPDMCKHVPISSDMKETFIGHNSAQDVMNHCNRKGTCMPTTAPVTATNTLSPRVSSSVVSDATIYFNEDMELTNSLSSYLPIQNLPLTKSNTVQTVNVTTLCSNNLQFNGIGAKSVDNIVTAEPEHPLPTSKFEPSKLTSDTQDLDESIFSKEKTASKDISPKFKCSDFDEDMELTDIIPSHILPLTKFNVHIVEQENSVTTSKPDSLKLINDYLDSLNESMLFEKKITVASKGNSPKKGNSKVCKEFLKGKSIDTNKISLKTKGRRGSKPKAKQILNRRRQSPINSKQIASPISPEMSKEVGFKAVSPVKPSSISEAACRKSTEERRTSYAKYTLSDSDSDNETLSQGKKAVHSKMSRLPKSNMATSLVEAISHSEANSVSEVASHSDVNSIFDVSSTKAKDDSELVSDCNLKDDFKSVGRCSFRNPKRTSKRRKRDVTSECLISLEIKHPSLQNLRTSKSCLEISSSSESSEKYGDEEIPGLSENSLPLLKSSKTSNKDESSKRRKPNLKSLMLKFSDQRTDMGNEIVESNSKPSKRISTVSFPKEKSRAVKVESDSAFVISTIQTHSPRAGSSKIVSSLDKEKNTISSAMSSCRKSVQLAVDDCYSAFQGIKNRKQLTSEHKHNLNDSTEIENVKGSKQHSSSRLLTVSSPHILKKRPTSQLKLSKEKSCNNSSSIEVKQSDNLLKHSQTEADNKLSDLLAGLDSTFEDDNECSKEISHNNSSSIDVKQSDNPLKHSQVEDNNKLSKLLASLDFTFEDDNGCSSEDITHNLDSVLQSTEGDLIKRPFSAVSEHRNRKRATDNSSDLFIEIESLCPQEILPKCLVTAQHCQTGRVLKNLEKTEVYDLGDEAKALETGLEQTHSHQSKSKPKELKGGKTSSNSQNRKNNGQVIQDALVGDDKSKSSNKKIPCKKNDLTVLKNAKIKNKKSVKNSEVDILTQTKTTPLKTIQLPTTEAYTLNEIDTQRGKTFYKQRPKKVKKSSTQKENQTISKDPVSQTQIKKGNEILNFPSTQSTIALETLPICLATEDDSNSYSKSSTSLGNNRPKRSTSVKSMKEPSLNCKMRR